MQSKNYDRAQKMLLADKYNLTKSQFCDELTELAKRYYELDGIVEEVFNGEELQVVLTLSIKKVKPLRRVLA